MNISTYKKKSFGKIKLFRKIYTHHQKNPPLKKWEDTSSVWWRGPISPTSIIGTQWWKTFSWGQDCEKNVFYHLCSSEHTGGLARGQS